jgi:hypothetical protein
MLGNTHTRKKSTKTISIIIFHPSTKYPRNNGSMVQIGGEQEGRELMRVEGVRNSYYINYIFAFYEGNVSGVSAEMGSNFAETDKFLSAFDVGGREQSSRCFSCQCMPFS